MLSDRFFRIYSWQILWSNLTMGTPFMWNAKKQSLQATLITKLSHSLSVVGLGFYAVFLCIQIVRCCHDGDTKTFRFYFLFILAICAIVDLIVAYPLFRNPELAATLINEFFSYVQKIHREYMPTFDPNTDSRNWYFDMYILSMWMVYIVFAFVIGCHYFFFPRWPCYLTSLIPPEWDLPIWIYVPFGLSYMYGLQMIWSLLLGFAVNTMTMWLYWWYITNEFICVTGNPRWQKCLPSFRDFDRIRRNYREYEILHKNMKEVFLSEFILPFQYVITFLGLFCNFSLIRYHHLLNVSNTLLLLIWTSVGAFSMLSMLNYSAGLNKKSVKALGKMRTNDWGSRLKKMEMKKFVKSCQPISIGYKNMYNIRALSELKFLLTLVRGTFRVLVAAKK